MGSLGWYRCYWCWQWDENGYIIDWIGGALCAACDTWYDEGGGPWEPTARTRVARMLHRELERTRLHRLLGPSRYYPGPFIEALAEFLRDWFEP